jgi:glycosyltransferase involved in cell wall biosynthesis
MIDSEMPKISVIVPTYNRERFIIKAIDSILNQTYKDYEIIVVDDGSTDETKKALQAYSQIKYIFQDNGGVSSARNTGIMAAKGEWVAFLDSDDEWTEDYLSVQMEQVKEFPQAVGHMTNAVSVLSDGQE